MPIATEVDHARGLVVARYTGAIALADLIESQNADAVSGRWQYRTLILCEEVTGIPSVADLRQVVRHASEVRKHCGKRGPVAIVAGSNDVVFGMARMYASLTDQDHRAIQAFRNAADASQWLADLAGDQPAATVDGPAPCPSCRSPRTSCTMAAHDGSRYYFCGSCGDHWVVNRAGLVQPLNIDFEP